MLLPREIGSLAQVTPPQTLSLGICTDDTNLKKIPWEYIVWPIGGFSPRLDRSVLRITPVNGAGPSH